ncbi:MAG: dockerin type I domain-containing protein [Pseudomonadota bacterium]
MTSRPFRILAPAASTLLLSLLGLVLGTMNGCTSENDGEANAPLRSFSIQEDVLENGVAVVLSDSPGGEKRFALHLPGEGSDLYVMMHGGDGNADLYVSRGKQPTTMTSDYRSLGDGNDEAVTAIEAAGGEWHVLVRATGTYANARLVALHETNCRPGDVDRDGELTPRDPELILGCYLGGGDCPCGDANRDGVVTPVDASCVVRELAGEPSCHGQKASCRRDDVNGDGRTTPSDALMIFKCYMETGECPACGDADRNGRITPADALCLFEHYLEEESCLDAPCIADVNGDGVVSDADVRLVVDCHLGTGACVPCSDVDGDGIVAAADAFCLARFGFGEPSCIAPCPPGQVMRQDGACLTVPPCGNGQVDPPLEECDDGINDGSYGHCLPDCSAMGAHCGDGTVNDDNESCDDGTRNGVFGYCSESCDGPAVLSCKPGRMMGDVDGDGAVSESDLLLTEAILAGKQAPPGDICCIDFDGDRLFEAADAERIRLVAEGVQPSPGICGVTCHACGLIGDANGDGQVSQDDVRLIDLLRSGDLPAPQGTCCVDLDADGEVSAADVASVRRIAAGLEPGRGACAPVDNSVGVITYHFRGRVDYTAEPLTVDFALIQDLHRRVVDNPFLSNADFILLPEFAYSTREHPIELDCAGPFSDCTLVNSNAVVDMVKELMQLALDHQVAIIVPLAERAIYDHEGESYEVFWNAAVVINRLGEIQFVRRKINDPTGTLPASLAARVNAEQFDSFQVLEIEAKSGQVFRSLLPLCAEISSDELLELVRDEHVDILFYPDGMFTVQPGSKTMKRIQFGTWPYERPAAEAYATIFTHTYNYFDKADYIVYAGGSDDRLGTFPTNQQPLSCINVEAVQRDGYSYARIQRR